MPLPITGTTITYPDGDVRSTGTVVHVEPLADGRSAVLLDRTAFHPVDGAWPDQPADRGVLVTAADRLTIVDGLVGGIAEGRLHLGSDLTVRTGTPGWTFVVAHVVDGAPPAVGETVAVEVDAPYRSALSAGHTACHLASLALDAALATAWTKTAPLDGLGNPAFDGSAIQRSRIVPHGSIDTYRIGKSMRRRGFDAAAFDDADLVAARVNAVLGAWVAAGGAVRIDRTGTALADRRTWVCDLPDGTATIPCGGTHVTDVARLGGVAVGLGTARVDGALEVTMTTSVGTETVPSAPS